MKRFILFMGILLTLASFPFQVFAAPEVVAQDPVYEFDPVPEGPSVSHVFILKNKGDEKVIIEKVVPP